MKKNIYLMVFILSLSSCASKKGVYISDIPQYNTSMGYKNLYIVDTIEIKEPIRFFTKNGYEFIMPKKHFDDFSGSEKELFENENAFLVGGLPIGLPSQFYVDDKRNHLCSEEKMLNTLNNAIQTAYYYNEQPDYFILLLVNGKYFNFAFIGIDGASIIKDKKVNFSYYKVVIPICN